MKLKLMSKYQENIIFSLTKFWHLNSLEIQQSPCWKQTYFIYAACFHSRKPVASICVEMFSTLCVFPLICLISNILHAIHKLNDIKGKFSFFHGVTAIASAKFCSQLREFDIFVRVESHSSRTFRLNLKCFKFY